MNELAKALEEPVKIYVLPGGRMPERQTDEANAFDVHLRALVSPYETDPANNDFRRTEFDFINMPDDPWMRKHVIERDGQLIYVLQPGEAVLGGVGIACAMKFPVFHWVTPRSGLAAKSRITLENAPGTVDSDYRGEAGVLIKNGGKEPFELVHQMRIAQMLFQIALIPKIVEVKTHAQLGKTRRGAGGFGSTGLFGSARTPESIRRQ